MSRSEGKTAACELGVEEGFSVSTERYKLLYEMLLEAIPSSVLVIDRQLRVVSANRNYLEKARRGCLGTVGELLQDVLPPGIPEQLDIVNRLRQVFETGRPTPGERMVYRAPGIPLRTYYYRLLPFRWKGEVENAVLLMDDVTEQVQLSEEIRRVERHLASVVQSASDIVLSTDTKGTILTCNPAAEKISGYTLQEMKGLLLFAFCDPEHQDRMKCAFSRLGARKNATAGEWNMVTKEKTVVPISWVFSLMKDDTGRPTGVVAVGRDLTERQKLERQLLQSQKLAALGVMAGGIAHEIRNPLAVCASAAQFLQEDGVTAEFRRECAEKIHTAIQRASVIIEKLLRFARPAGHEVKQTDLVSVLQEAVALVANQAKVQKVELGCRLPARPLPIEGTADLLQQAFLNLFLNALNAMPNGGHLDITAEQDGEVWSVRVADSGCGIRAADLDRIFDPFYTTSAPGKGTGLGLSLCYSIIQQHLGSIEVESTEGKGSAFIVRLPRCPSGSNHGKRRA